MQPHTPSYYAATANPWDTRALLAGDDTADVVVIGGGFTGLSAALHAAEAGLSVVLLEAERIGWAASGRNGGQMIPGLRWSAEELIGKLGRERAKATLALANLGACRVRDRIAQHGIDCALAHGHLQAAAKPADYDELAREAEALADLLGYNTLALVPRDAVGEHVASSLYFGGLYDANGGHLHPLNYALGLARAALQAGVRIHEGSRVTRLTDGAQVVARTAQGSVRARFAVLAADTETAALDRKLGRMTVGVANYNVATEPLGEERIKALFPSGAAVSDTKFVLNYYRPSADGRLIFGGGEKYSPRPPADIRAFVRKYLEQVFPQLAGVGIDYAWGGMVGVTMYRLPDLGRQGNIFHAHGWSGHGVLMTTLAGELIAEAMVGTAERFDVLAGLPHRPFPGGPWLARPLATLGLIYYALRDRL